MQKSFNNMFAGNFSLEAAFIGCDVYMCPQEGSIYHDLKTTYINL